MLNEMCQLQVLLNPNVFIGLANNHGKYYKLNFCIKDIGLTESILLSVSNN